jgi:hypothetical protein
MPYETVQEKVVQERRIRVCARCRAPMPDVPNRGKANMVGGFGGSLGASLGGSMLLGSVLGPVGAIGGAIVGSIAGARAGRDASNAVVDAVESQQDSMCSSCQKVTQSYNHQEKSSSNNTNDSSWGTGQSLGSGRPLGGQQWGASERQSTTRSSGFEGQGGHAVGGGQRLGSGEPVRQNPAHPGDRIGEVASAAGRGISDGISWMKQSVSNVIDGAKKAGDNNQQQQR